MCPLPEGKVILLLSLFYFMCPPIFLQPLPRHKVCIVIMTSREFDKSFGTKSIYKAWYNNRKVGKKHLHLKYFIAIPKPHTTTTSIIIVTIT
jgi:hypothetical protein